MRAFVSACASTAHDLALAALALPRVLNGPSGWPHTCCVPHPCATHVRSARAPRSVVAGRSLAST
eukprot:2157543-Pleurochrysis_carterae.AAC.3